MTSSQTNAQIGILFLLPTAVTAGVSSVILGSGNYRLFGIGIAMASVLCLTTSLYHLRRWYSLTKNRVNNAVTRAGGGWGPFVKAMDSVDVRAKELLERAEVKFSKKPVGADQFRASIAAIHAFSTMERPDTLGYRAAMLSIRDECEHLVPELEKIRGLHQG